MIEIQNTISDSQCPDENWFITTAQKILALLAKNKLAKRAKQSQQPAELLIRLVDEQESRRLNHTYRKQNKPTNILAFTDNKAELPPQVQVMLGNKLGDLVVCFELAKREAKAGDKAINDHLTHLIVHGILHLLGYHHSSNNNTKIMENLEDKILKEFAIYLSREPLN